MPDRFSRRRKRWSQLFWLVVLWTASVATMAVVVELIRLSMTAAGLKTH
ncbi:DUF2474 domain-containing protein [Cupriavidus necator]|uniref:DUF2474 domain-containing protein n=1 Tax=Cupriavidus necator TaxID=106590 RepID=A0A2P1DV29_CUPNE|nr:DUF2474 domain-containing protein [Cupriavidus necator]AVK72246.1 DUF2474 domain-containing protein [Cupriavidus necator]